ncbi:MAG: translation initiation factor IF-2, partial [Anaerolineae bacterium]|nr:translation initiation factor IF-2 [Anaerolineae bacterium]
QEIVANPNADGQGVILESEVDRSRGVMATLLVLNGTLKVGEIVIAGIAHGRIKAMFDEKGQPVKSAGPSTPVSVLGLDDLPQAGERFEVVKSEKEARQIVDERKQAADELRQSGGRKALTLEDIFNQFNANEAKELNLILKVDVNGSLQPIVDTLNDISEKNREGIRVRILASDVGNITESDVMLASAAKAIIIGFNVEADNAARRSADAQGVDIRLYKIIYKLFEEIELALQGMLEPVYADKTIGVAEVRQVFRISKVGTIAGCMIKEGEARRNAKARVRRAGTVISEKNSVSSLKRVQEDVREVRSGFECGIGLSDFEAFEAGDLIEFYITERVS